METVDEIATEPSTEDEAATTVGERSTDQTREPHAPLPHFAGLVIDGAPRLLEESYRLRYQVYCLERRFLPPELYPDQLEVDVFDRHSVHIGVLDAHGEVVATARLIEPSAAGLPLFDHCTIFPDEVSGDDTARRVVEISRLSMSRKYNRRAGDEFHSLEGVTGRTDGPERRRGPDLVLALFKACYQASKRGGFTHWLAAHDKSLQRMIVKKYGFPFRRIGPETDYYGAVAPYLMDLQEFDQVILSHRISALDDFLNGLEPELRPRDGDTGPSEHPE
jgi:N-acyl amino acid synthase of PEP-CTERM/exosortase system